MSVMEEDDGKDDNKRRTRNRNEKKRRDQFNVVVDELLSLVGQGGKKKMDKALVLQATIEMVKKHKGFKCQTNSDKMNTAKPPFLEAAEYCQLLLEVIDGFILVVEMDDCIGYVSETVTTALGHDPAFMTGKSIYSLLHPRDHFLVRSVLRESALSKHRHFDRGQMESCIKFSCHVSNFSLDLGDHQTYKYCKVAGCMKSCLTTVPPGAAEFYLFVVRAMNPALSKDLAFVDESSCEFTSRLSLEWKFLHMDHKASSIIGYFPFEVLGTSGYDYCHHGDLEDLLACHRKLVLYGETTSDYYRFLTKGHRWIWLKTHHYISYNQWNSKPEFVVCVSSAASNIHVARERTRMADLLKQRSNRQNASVNSMSSWAPGDTDLEDDVEAFREKPAKPMSLGSRLFVGGFSSNMGDIFSDILDYSM